MRLRLIAEDRSDSGESEYIIEFALVGPKSKGGSRKFGAFLLPHKLMTVDWDLVENPEYLDRLIIYDLTNEQPGVAPLQGLKQFLVDKRLEHGELVLAMNWNYSSETHDSYWGGSKIDNGPRKHEDWSSTEFSNGYLLIDGRRYKIPNSIGYEIFEIMRPLIESDV